MATHASVLAWRIPWIQEPGGLQSMGSQRVRHNGSDLARIHATLHKAICWHFFQQEVPGRASGKIRGSVMVKLDTCCSLEP